MNGRVYDPKVGRFLSVDPVFQFPENTQSLNPYTYVLNSPLSMTDPTGYQCSKDDDSGCTGNSTDNNNNGQSGDKETKNHVRSDSRSMKGMVECPPFFGRPLGSDNA